MSRTTIWVLCWAALSGAGWLLHSGEAPDMQHLAADMPTYLPSLILAAAGQFCLYRAIRSGVGELWGGITGRSDKPATAKPVRSFDTLEEPVSDFDADAAFARYMERRQAEGEEEGQSPVAARRPARQEISRPRAPQGGFGRKAV